MHEIMAFGPVSTVRPYIPECLIIKDMDSSTITYITHTVEKVIERSELDRLLSTREMVPLMPLVDLGTDSWICIGISTHEIFLKAEEAKFRASKAIQLLEKSQNSSGCEALKLLQACAHIIQLDLKGLMHKLESNRTSKAENFIDIFKRIKPQ